MKRYLSILIPLVLVIGAISCVKQKEKNYPDEPQIYYEGMNDSIVYYFDSTSVLEVKFRFTDGDGNIANIENDSTIYVSDYRSDTLFAQYSFPMPVVAADLRSGKALEGEVTLRMAGYYFPPRIDTTHIKALKDTLDLKIYIEDEAGNKSNEITTGTIYTDAS